MFFISLWTSAMKISDLGLQPFRMPDNGHSNTGIIYNHANPAMVTSITLYGPIMELRAHGLRGLRKNSIVSSGTSATKVDTFSQFLSYMFFWTIGSINLDAIMEKLPVFSGLSIKSTRWSQPNVLSPSNWCNYFATIRMDRTTACTLYNKVKCIF